MATEPLLETVEKGIQEIYDNLLNNEPIALQLSQQVHENYRLSAINLYRYLLVRSHDLRKFHNVLTDLGLSGLRTSEGYIYKDVANVLRWIKMIRGEVWSPSEDLNIIGFRRSRKLLKKHTNTLFGKPKNKRKTRIMVTIPSEAADDEKIIQKLIKSGMEVARINMSHDDVKTWKKMMAIIRSESKKNNKEIKIFMDISGPKIRTGAIQKKGKKSKKSYLSLSEGDQLLINKKNSKGKNAIYDKLGKLVSAACISITTPEILDGVKIGERICFDDGKIESQIVKINPDGVTVKVINGNGEAMKLKPEKGVNLPDSNLLLESLTKKDMKDLLFAVNEADILGYSFVRSVEDIRCLKNELDKYDRMPAIVLKIENKEAFKNLPLLLLEGMKFPNVGVMIARGDLMVEIGDERIAEVQDQILWICEAAHVPVIWATQVFESLAKKGQASRAEVTDAAKSTRAECVMLNKGPFITKAVKKLSSILIRMEKHTSKKKSQMRPLSIAKNASELIPNMVELEVH
jgi:pyruvate kinase